MSGLSEQDLSDLRGLGQGQVPAAVEQIVQRHVDQAVAAFKAEAVAAIEAAAADFCTGCSSCDGGTHYGQQIAASIVRDLSP